MWSMKQHSTYSKHSYSVQTIHQVVVCKRLKTMENCKTFIPKMWSHKGLGPLQECLLGVPTVRPLTKKSLMFWILSGRLWMVDTCEVVTHGGSTVTLVTSFHSQIILFSHIVPKYSHNFSRVLKPWAKTRALLMCKLCSLSHKPKKHTSQRVLH